MNAMATIFKIARLCLLFAASSSIVAARCSILDLGVNPPCSEKDQVRMTPENPVAYTGDDVTLNCSGHVDPRQLVLVVNSHVISDTQMRILDDNTASFTIANVSMDLNLANLRCGVRNRAWSHCDGCQILNVYEQPLPVVNVSCVVHDWTSGMVCSWQLAHSYTRTPEVTLMWRVPVITCNWTACPRKQQKHCLWDSTHFGVLTNVKYVDVVMYVKEGDRLAHSYYRINIRTIVKPDPVTSLQSTPISSRCIVVAWQPGGNPHRKIYEVRYSSKWDTSKGIIHTKDTDSSKEENKTVTICNLIPHTAYEITVRAKPFMDSHLNSNCVYYGGCNDSDMVPARCLSGSGYWSDVRTTQASTYGDVPSAAPLMASGGYMWRSLESGYRGVNVYWKPLRDIDKNGPLLGYDVNVTSSSDNKTSYIEHYLARYVTFDSVVLKTDQDYTMTVKARNKNGTSPGSTVHIPRQKQVPAPPAIIVTIANKTEVDGDTDVEVTWHDFEAPFDVTGYTLFMCKMDEGNCAYESALEWHHVPRDNLSMVLRVVYSTGQFLYGLAVDTRRGSSGFHWQTCVYTRGADLRTAPSNLEVHAGVGTSLLFVRWDLLPCGSGQARVSMYRLEYCEVDGELPFNCHVAEVSSTTTSLDLNGLEEEQVYGVRIQAVTQEGSQGPWSEAVQATTNKDTSKAKLAVLVIGITCVVSLLCLLGWCYWRFKKRYQTPHIEDILKGLQPQGKDLALSDDNKKAMANNIAATTETATDPSTEPDTLQNPIGTSDSNKLTDTGQTSPKTISTSDQTKLKTNQNSNECYRDNLENTSLVSNSAIVDGCNNPAYSGQSQNQSGQTSHGTIHSSTADNADIQNNFSDDSSQQQFVWNTLTDMFSEQNLQTDTEWRQDSFSDMSMSDLEEQFMRDPGKKESDRVSVGYVRTTQGSNGEFVMDSGSL